MQRVEFGLGEEAARDAGLVGEEEHEIAGVVQPPDRLRRIRHPADALLRAHIAVVVIDDAVAVEEGGRLRERAGLRRSFPRRLAHHRLLDLVANAVSDREMDLLDHRRVVAGRDQQMIAGRAHGLARRSGESDRDKPALARLAQRRQDVRRAPRRGERRAARRRAAPRPST